MLLISSAKTNAFFCLYDFDTSMPLFRIDTSKPFKPVPTSGSLIHILFTSSWEIREGNDADWDEVLEYLQVASSPEFENSRIITGRWTWPATKQSVLQSLSYYHIRPQK